jgi:hypothetical protein
MRFLNDQQEQAMAGATKPNPRTRPGEKYKDGGKKSGGVNVQRHAGPGRASKTRPTGTKGAQLAKRGKA